MSSWWSVIHGYRNPVMDAAIRRQLSSFSHVMFGGLTHQPAVELAESLLAMAPAEPGRRLERVFLADSGSISVEVALKMAVQFQTAGGRPKRQRFLTIRGGYHGDTFAAMGVCDPVDGMHSSFPRAVGAQCVCTAPACRCKSHHSRHRRMAGRSGRAGQAAFQRTRGDHRGADAARRRRHVHLPGRVRADPARYRGPPRIVADPGRDRHGASGEPVNSLPRSTPALSPDILCVGKALTGGYLTLAATLCTGEVARTVSSGEAGALLHGPTFMANLWRAPRPTQASASLQRGGRGVPT